MAKVGGAAFNGGGRYEAYRLESPIFTSASVGTPLHSAGR